MWMESGLWSVYVGLDQVVEGNGWDGEEMVGVVSAGADDAVVEWVESDDGGSRVSLGGARPRDIGEMAGDGDREVEVSFCEAGPGKCGRNG